jgi:hypothetical protein
VDALFAFPINVGALVNQESEVGKWERDKHLWRTEQRGEGL